MPLRKAFGRTLSILGTNSANAHESIGPRTPEGKDRLELSALGTESGKVWLVSSAAPRRAGAFWGNKG